jgi:hypothetical protein
MVMFIRSTVVFAVFAQCPGLFWAASDGRGTAPDLSRKVNVPCSIDGTLEEALEDLHNQFALQFFVDIVEFKKRGHPCVLAQRVMLASQGKIELRRLVTKLCEQVGGRYEIREGYVIIRPK